MPRMDNKETSRRFPPPPAPHPPPPQDASDASNPLNRPNTSGAEFGSPGGLSGARQFPRLQQPQPGQGIPGTHEFTQNPVPNGPEQADNAHATIWAGIRQHGPTGHAVHPPGQQYGQDGGRGEIRTVFAGYGGPTLSELQPAVSPQPADTRNSTSNSPTGSAYTQLSYSSSEGGNRTLPDASHALGAAGHVRGTLSQQTSTNIHVQNAYDTSLGSASPESTLGTFAPRVGVARTWPEDITQHGPTENIQQRPALQRFATSGSIVSSPPLHASNDPRLDVRSQVPLLPQSPPLDLRARQPSLEDGPAHLGRYLHPQQQPYGVPPPSHPPLAPVGMGNVQYPYRCLNYIEASRREDVTLDMLEDPAHPGEKPNFPYPLLIRAAIQSSPKQALTLQGIYDALQQRYEWFRAHKDDKAWLGSIRHNLSLNKLFRKVQKPITEPGKGSYWTVDASAGEGNKRERKRNKPTGMIQQAQQEAAGPSAASHATEHSSSGEDSIAQSVGTPHGQIQPSMPYLGRSAYEEPTIDPALLSQSRLGGQGQMQLSMGPTPTSTSYVPCSESSSPTIIPPSEDPRFAAPDQFSMRPMHAAAYGQPVLRQGPSGFDAWEASFMAGPPMWSAQAPAPVQTTGTAVPPSAYSTPLPSSYHRGTAASPFEAGGSSSSSTSEVDSAYGAAGSSVPQVYRRGSGSSSSSSSQT